MPTSKETLVRVDGFWKIIPSVRPGSRWCSSRACWRRFSSSARSSTSSRSSLLQSETRVNERPFSLSATATIAKGAKPTSVCGAARRLLRTECDLLIRGGTIYDGRGGPAFAGDVAIRGDRIVAVGSLRGWQGRDELDAGDLAVAPGFVNMLSWANESLLEDGRAQSDLRQGVTLEVLGEGASMGPLTDTMKEDFAAQSLFG